MIQKPCELLVGTNPGSPRSIAVLLPLPAFFEGARLLFTSHLYPLLFLIQLTATLVKRQDWERSVHYQGGQANSSWKLHTSMPTS